MWMNEYEISEAAARYRAHPILGPATRTLENLMDAVNGGSDGWPYWKAPGRSAAKLMTLILAQRDYPLISSSDADVMAQEYRKALTPIRAFRTRSRLDFVIVEAP